MLFSLFSLASALNLAEFKAGLFETGMDPGVYRVDVGLEANDTILASFGFFNLDKL
jgi:hypothetical protein